MAFSGKLIFAAVCTLAATAAFAQSMHDKREEVMKAQGAQIGVLAGMAQEKAPYDAAAATAAATKLAEIAAWDAEELFPQGDATGRALPAIWENWDDFQAKHEALVTASATMATEAGKGLDALKAAIGPIGAACGGCHQAYRKAE